MLSNIDNLAEEFLIQNHEKKWRDSCQLKRNQGIFQKLETYWPICMLMRMIKRKKNNSHVAKISIHILQEHL